MKVSRFVEVIRLELAELLVWAKTAQNRLRQHALTQRSIRVSESTTSLWDSTPGLSSLGVPGVPWHTQILVDQLTLFQPGARG